MFEYFKRLTLNSSLLATLISVLIFTTVLAASGDLDTSFSGDGWVSTKFSGRDGVAYGIAIQPNGKIVVVGDSRLLSTDNSDFGVVRYNPNGSLDTTFSMDGKLVTDFGRDERAEDVAVQADNKIVVVGETCNQDFTICDVALARYLPTGRLDTTFSGDGKVITNFGGVNDKNGAYAVAIQSNGKIVVAGYVKSGPNFDFAIYRYNANGSLDTTFSGDGIGVGNWGLGKDDFANDLVIQSDGKIIVAGSTGVSSHNFGIARLNSNGTADTTFSGDGRQITNLGGDEYAYGVALQPNGKIVVVGEKFDLDLDLQLFAIARYNANGSLDTTFNRRGFRVISFIAGADSFAEDVVVQPNGKIVVLGTVTNGSFPSYALVRLNGNGSFDNTFSGNGKAQFAIGSGGDISAAIARQPSDGKYVLAGSSWVTIGLDFAALRVLP